MVRQRLHPGDRFFTLMGFPKCETTRVLLEVSTCTVPIVVGGRVATIRPTDIQYTTWMCDYLVSLSSGMCFICMAVFCVAVFSLFR